MNATNHDVTNGGMNPGESLTCSLIEHTLNGNPAFRKIDEKMYVVRQGSSIVMVTVVALDHERAIVRCVAQLVQGVQMEKELALELLKLNGTLRFGAFAFVPDGDLVLFLHSILGGETLDPPELLATIRDVALIADEWDDRIIARFGGKRMQDLLEQQALSAVLSAEVDISVWDAR